MVLPESTAQPASLLLALTTEATPALAEALAEALLARRLAACVALQPITSHYHWQGSQQRGAEVQLLIKSHPTCRVELEAAVHRLHSYSTPEWIHWQAQCSPAYASWLAASCGVSPGDAAPARADRTGGAAPAG